MQVKRILIITDIKQDARKLFIDQTRKLTKGFIRLGHDATTFSYSSALRSLSPIKSKGFAARFYKARVDRLLAKYTGDYGPDIVLIVFPRSFDAETVQHLRRAAPSAVLIGHDGDPWPQRTSSRIPTASQMDIMTATNDGTFLDAYRRGGAPLCIFLPNTCDPDMDRRHDVQHRWETDILWTGKTGHGVAGSDPIREELVGALAEQRRAQLYGCLGRPKIGGLDYLHAISGARIGVSISAVNTERLYHSDRLTHYAACGAFVLAKRFPDCEMLYRDGQHVKYFDTVEEFFELADWYLAHEQERRRIADAGMKWVHERFNCAQMAQYVLDLADQGRYTAPWT